MIQGLLTAVAVTACWVFLQNLLMHIRPTDRRFKAMALGFVLSLPFIHAVYRWVPLLPPNLALAAHGEAWTMGLIHAYALHLMLFFFYAECFYYAERSVTLRLFVEIMAQGDKGAQITDLQRDYGVGDMIRPRLDVLAENGFIEQRDGRWRLRPKGAAYARLMQFSTWLYQCRPPQERLQAAPGLTSPTSSRT